METYICPPHQRPLPIEDSLSSEFYLLQGITKEQMDWLDRRDHGQCRWSENGEECLRGWKTHDVVERHHVIPQCTYKKDEARLHQDHPDKNSPFNLITLCYYHHTLLHHPTQKKKFNETEYLLKLSAIRRTYRYLKEHPEDQYPQENGFKPFNIAYQSIRI